MDVQISSPTPEKVKQRKFMKKCPECGEENALSRKRCRKDTCHHEFVTKAKSQKNNHMQQRATLEAQADALHIEHGYDIAVLYWKNQGNGKSLVYRYGTPGQAESFIGSTKQKTSEPGATVLKLFIDYLAAALQKPSQEKDSSLPNNHTSTSTAGDPPPVPSSSSAVHSSGDPPPPSQERDLESPSAQPVIPLPTTSPDMPLLPSPSVRSSVVHTDAVIHVSDDADTSESPTPGIVPVLNDIAVSSPQMTNVAVACSDETPSTEITMTEVTQPTEDNKPDCTKDQQSEPMEVSDSPVPPATSETDSYSHLLSVDSASSATIVIESMPEEMIPLVTQTSEDLTREACPSDGDDAQGLYATTEITRINETLVLQTVTKSPTTVCSTNSLSGGTGSVACASTSSTTSAASDSGQVKNKETGLPGQSTLVTVNTVPIVTVNTGPGTSGTSLSILHSAEQEIVTSEQAVDTEESSQTSQGNNSCTEGNWTCHFCRKIFPDNAKLSAHLPSHRKDKPFKCEHCNKSFAQPCSLTKHLNRHSEKSMQQTLYKCQDCGQGFSAYAKLRQHFRVHTGEKPFKCQECGKGFKVASHVAKHQRIHTGEKPFVCTECGKAFTESGTLKRHVRTHTGEKPFECDQCDKAFSQAGSLSMHMHVHLKAMKKEETVIVEDI